MKHALPEEHLFTIARWLQNELGAWRDCSFKSCRGTKSCVGGPRGTRLKTGGWPLCTEEGRERNRIAGRIRTWPGENAPEDETISQRAMRRITEMMTRMTMQAKLENDWKDAKLKREEE